MAIYEHAISSEEIRFFLNCSRNIFGEIYTLIATKLELAHQHKISLPVIVYALKFTRKLKEKINTAKMVNVDIKLGTTLIPMYDGSPETLHSFIDATELFNSITNG